MGERGCFIEHLILEHVQISKELDRLKDFIADSERVSPAAGLELLNSLCTSLESHHQKEEKLLFPILQKLAPLNRGGSRCSLFMTHLLNENLGRDFMNKAPQFGFEIESPRAEIREIVEMNSPLTIPIYEHWGGKIALQILKKYLSEMERAGAEKWNDFVIEVLRFDRMMRLHIEKEDTCLFVLADSFLPEALQSELFLRYAVPFSGYNVS